MSVPSSAYQLKRSDTLASAPQRLPEGRRTVHHERVSKTSPRRLAVLCPRSALSCSSAASLTGRSGARPSRRYDSLSIHYQFHESQGDPTKDPIATWHQGGPGGSSIDVGLYTEMGYFQVDDEGTFVNEYAWNKVASMLYLESPAGSGSSSGYSTCIKDDKPVACEWTDQSQAEAYAHTLAAFFQEFPEFKENDLYFTGESYAGQCESQPSAHAARAGSDASCVLSRRLC